MSDKPPFLPPPAWWLREHPEHDAPAPGPTPDISEPIPSHRWAWISLAVAVYATVGIPVRVAIEGLTPGDTVLGLLGVEAMMIAWVAGSYYWLNRRLALRKQWREQREMEWWLKDLPEDRS